VTFTVNVQVAVAGMVPVASEIVLLPGTAVITPAPHVPVTPFGFAITRPEGSRSVNATVSVTVSLGFRIEKVILVVYPTGIASKPNVLSMTGGATMMMLADAVFPRPPSIDVTRPVRLFLVPLVVPVTVRVNVQTLAGAIEMPAPVILVVVKVTPEARHPTAVTGPDGTKPTGIGSEKPTPVRVTVGLGFVMVNLSVLVVPSGIMKAPKAFEIEGGATTVIEAEAVLPLPPSVELIFPVVLFFTPNVVPVTTTVKMHVPFAGTVSGNSVTLPGVIDAKSAHVIEVMGAEAERPGGMLSLNVTLVSGTAFGFVIANLMVVLVPSGIVAAPNDLMKVGGRMLV
jgi:hypothetical protein